MSGAGVPSYEHLQVAQDGHVATITFDRPEKLNAFTTQMLRDITAILRGFEAAGDVRACILRGSGRAFSTGADLGELVHAGPQDVLRSNRDWIAMYNAIECVPFPVIAQVHGYAIAGGTETTLACDLVIASDDAKLGLAEIKVGVIPGAGACVRLTRWVGRAQAKEILMTGDLIPAEEAKRLGLVNRVVPREKLEEETMALARQLASRSPLAIAAAKRAVNVGSELDLEKGIEYVLREFALLFATEDKVEGMSAFLEKREANFKGR